MKKAVIMMLALLLGSVVLQAQHLRLANAFSDHMVLQRDSNVKIWGWGKPGATVQLMGSWPGENAKTTIDDKGFWSATMTTPSTGSFRLFSEGTQYGPFKLTVKSNGETLTVDDIMLGEVWICSGQSNMEMPMRGYGFQNVEGSTEAIMAAMETADMIRVLDIKTDMKTEPEEDIEAVWERSTPGVVSKTSAVAYFFAKRLTKSLGCPVGIIVNAWGGSRIEPWMTREMIENAGLTKEQLEAIDAIHQKKAWPQIPELIWNGRVAPIVGYGAKGILWYQGCSNIGQDCYNKLQDEMVLAWRRAWGIDLPFIYTLLAPYEHGDADGRWRPFFVENQMKTAEEIDKAWFVCTETLGNKVTVHPAQKKEVADMMCLRALQDVYGAEIGINIEHPRIKTVEYGEEGYARVKLTNVWSDLGSISSREVIGFEMAGPDKVFRPATAEIDWDGETIYLFCKGISHPVAVRYSWRNWMGSNLAKTSGIPVPPFRTDDWEQ